MRKGPIKLEREDIADFVRTKVKLLERRRTRRAIDEELEKELGAFDAAVLRDQLKDAPDVAQLPAPAKRKPRA